MLATAMPLVIICFHGDFKVVLVVLLLFGNFAVRILTSCIQPSVEMAL